jgi:toxoflavin synthase
MTVVTPHDPAICLVSHRKLLLQRREEGGELWWRLHLQRCGWGAWQKPIGCEAYLCGAPGERAAQGGNHSDVACGFSFYTRLLKQRGAAQVIGVDISLEMIRLAHQQEQAEPLGITYQVGDAVTLPPLGSFDLVTAVHLLTYATSKDQLLGMFRSVYDNLVAGGRFIAYTNNPAFTLSKPHCTKCGVTVLRLEPEEDWYACEAEFVTDPPFRVRWYQWRQAPYEWALQEAGFQDFAWYPSEVAPEDIAR